MRGRFFIQSLIFFLIVSVGLTGCSKGRKPSSTAGKGAGGMGNAGDVPPLGSGSGSDIAVGERGLATSGPLHHGEFQPVYFDYDSARVRPDEVTKLQTIADKLGASRQLIIEGHADERGTAEYNRALGERRALACREELVSLGVPSGNISTISYGEERPATSGHDESAWSQNRRCEFATVGE